MRLRTDWRLGLIGLLLIGSVAVGGYALHADKTRTTAREGALVASVAAAKVVSAQDSAAHAAAERVTDVVHDTLHVRIVAYDTIRAKVILDPESPRDTAFDIAMLPGLVHAADSLRDVAIRDSVAAFAERQAAAELDAGRVRVIAVQDTLIALLQHHPRLSAVGQLRYDPIAKVPGVAAHVDVRTVGQWSLGALGDYRVMPGERPRLYVTLSHPLF